MKINLISATSLARNVIDSGLAPEGCTSFEVEFAADMLTTVRTEYLMSAEHAATFMLLLRDHGIDLQIDPGFV
jgi:hypothetical protein